jgi:DNA-binding HxlR family transcriptional regulator
MEIEQQALSSGECEGILARDGGVNTFLSMLTQPWTLHLLWLLTSNGPMRFGALRRKTSGISARLLTVRLRLLEERGFLSRSVRPTKPPEVTYIPTSRLLEMGPFLLQVHTLARKWEIEDVARKPPGIVDAERESNPGVAEVRLGSSSLR